MCPLCYQIQILDMSHNFTSALVFIIGATILAPFAIVSLRMVISIDALRIESKARVASAALQANEGETFEPGPDGVPTKFCSFISSTMLPLSIRSKVLSSLYVRRSTGMVGLLCVLGLIVCLAYSCFVPTNDIDGALTTIQSENRVIWMEKGEFPNLGTEAPQKPIE